MFYIFKQGDQRQGKSERNRVFRSPVFKSGKVRENGHFGRNSGKNQGISFWIREKIREFRYIIYLLFQMFLKKIARAFDARILKVFHSKLFVRAAGARILIRYRYCFLLNTILEWASMNLGSGKKTEKVRGKIREFENWLETGHPVKVLLMLVVEIKAFKGNTKLINTYTNTQGSACLHALAVI